MRFRSFSATVVCLLVVLLFASTAPSVDAFDGSADEQAGTNPFDVFDDERQGKITTADDSRAGRLTEDPIGFATGRGFNPTGTVASAFQVSCADQPDHWICNPDSEEYDGDGEDDPPATPVPTPTPEPTPDPRIAEDAAFRRAQQVAIDWINLQRPSFDTAPPPLGQVVHLKNYMWILESKWQSVTMPVETEDGIDVTITVTPVSSIWLLEEELSGRTFDYHCPGRGHEYANNPDDVSTCGHTFDHSSSVVGDVALTVAVAYELTVVSSLEDWRSNFVDGQVVAPTVGTTIDLDSEADAVSDTTHFPLQVHEVLTWGIEEDGLLSAPDYDTGPITPDDGPSCGRFEQGAYWLAGGVALEFFGVGCDDVKQVIEFLGEAALACGGGIATSIKETVALLIGIVTDPVGTVQDGVAGIIELISLANEDPGAFVTTVGYGVLLTTEEDWNAATPEEQALIAVGGICALAFEILTGKAWQKFKDVLPNPPGSTRPTPEGETPGRRPRPCSHSSFPTGTHVRMGSGSLTAIEDIRPGDYVLAADPLTGQWSAERVLAQWSYVDTEHMTTAALDDGSAITATDHHRFWVESDQQWVELEHVAAGDQLLSPNGVTAVADVVTHPQAETLVWELDVAGPDTFTVHTGTTDLLAHNSPCGDAEVQDILNGRRNNRDPNVTKNTHGPAESVAAGVRPDGMLVSTGPKYNLLGKKPKNGPGVDAGLADALRDTVRRNADGDFIIDNVDDYLNALDDIYDSLKNPLNDEVRDAIKNYIKANDGVIPNDVGGGFPGTHSEIQAVNDLMNQGVAAADVSVGTIRVPGATDFPACNNCNPILGNLGITAITD